ncbi:hypothetical protein [Nubsella zeaxanthinifaciens]|uniref:hypothetical protein n=1 Tax=Nubsella zeaxanthinifaciens TaxID=392412 RepID=UPI000DE4A686|nr:hypothetical protein [Nubsella zeaxanthinifaciens]
MTRHKILQSKDRLKLQIALDAYSTISTFKLVSFNISQKDNKECFNALISFDDSDTMHFLGRSEQLGDLD